MASKNALKLKVVLVTFAGILLALRPNTCQAQAEINPDHYEVTNAAPKPPVQNRPTPTRSASAGLKHQKPTPSSQGLLRSGAVHPKRSRNMIHTSKSLSRPTPRPVIGTALVSFPTRRLSCPGSPRNRTQHQWMGHLHVFSNADADDLPAST